MKLIPLIKEKTSFSFDYYSTIGGALVQCEILKYKDGYGSAKLNIEFKDRTCSIPVEILESYLDDLLHIETKDKGLFIERTDGEYLRNKYWVPIGFSILSIGLCYLFDYGFFAHIISVLAIALLAYFGSWMLTPYNSFRRRLFFGQLVSNEISRRRGGGNNNSWNAELYSACSPIA